MKVVSVVLERIPFLEHVEALAGGRVHVHAHRLALGLRQGFIALEAWQLALEKKSAPRDEPDSARRPEGP